MQLEKIKPLNNYVLLKAKLDPSKVKLGDTGVILFVDTDFEKEKNSVVVCEVIAVPDRLVFGWSTDINKFGGYVPKENSMDWKTNMELRVGDEVIIHFNVFLHTENIKLNIEGEDYFFCKYSDIFVAKRRWKDSEIKEFYELNGEDINVSEDFCEQNNISVNKDTKEIFNVIMLNGYCLVEPLEKEIKSDLIILPDNYKEQNTDKIKVRVCFNGSDNQEYLYEHYQDAEGLRCGDVIMIEKNCDIPLEYNETLNGKKKYWRVQKNLVQAVERKEVVNV